MSTREPVATVTQRDHQKIARHSNRLAHDTTPYPRHLDREDLGSTSLSEATHRERGIMTDKYLKLSEVGERLGVTERFARRLIEEKRIEYKKFGHYVRVAESVLLAYIESCTVQPVQRACHAAGRRSR